MSSNFWHLKEMPGLFLAGFSTWMSRVSPTPCACPVCHAASHQTANVRHRGPCGPCDAHKSLQLHGEFGKKKQSWGEMRPSSTKIDVPKNDGKYSNRHKLGQLSCASIDYLIRSLEEALLFLRYLYLSTGYTNCLIRQLSVGFPSILDNSWFSLTKKAEFTFYAEFMIIFESTNTFIFYHLLSIR